MSKIPTRQDHLWWEACDWVGVNSASADHTFSSREEGSKTVRLGLFIIHPRNRVQDVHAASPFLRFLVESVY